MTTAQPEHPTFGVVPSTGPSMLDGLVVDMDEHPALNQTSDFPVPRRPGWEIRCSIDIPYEEQAAWRKAAMDASMPDGINEVKLAATVLAVKCTAILINGELLSDHEGNAVTFASQALHKKFGVERPIDAVRKVFAGDGYVNATASSLLQEAGYGSQASPTRR